MLLETFKQFKDFELLDTGDGYRLERWGKFILARPDPQIIWHKHLAKAEWDKADAIFDERTRRWEIKTKIPKSWTIQQGDTKMFARLSPFKHTGVFAEQAAQWEWMEAKTKSKKKLKILNLFGYTGGATMALTKLGHFVTHVDASKPAIAWGKDNQKLNGFKHDAIRWILDDAAKFVARELKRGQTYDGIIMDPPAFGHAPSGKTWKFNDDLPELLQNSVQLLSDSASFLVINGYATNSSALALKNTLEDAIRNKKGSIEFGELCLKQKDSRLISTGIFARWYS
jgi:23S rRNA (cytosine1962-C5)-methyltransferase